MYGNPARWKCSCLWTRIAKVGQKKWRCSTLISTIFVLGVQVSSSLRSIDSIPATSTEETRSMIFLENPSSSSSIVAQVRNYVSLGRRTIENKIIVKRRSSSNRFKKITTRKDMNEGTILQNLDNACKIICSDNLHKLLNVHWCKSQIAVDFTHQETSSANVKWKSNEITRSYKHFFFFFFILELFLLG